CQYVDWSPKNNPFCNGYTRDVNQDVCPPKQFNGRPHILFRNNGKGPDGKVTFTDVSASVGLNLPGNKDRFGSDVELGKGLGVVIADFNGDRRPDIYVANDTVDNFLYVNRGMVRGWRNAMGVTASVGGWLARQPGIDALAPLAAAVAARWHFEEVAGDALVAKDDTGRSNGSMGVDIACYEGSGYPSIFVTNYEGELHALYRNLWGEQPQRLQFNFQTKLSQISLIETKFVGFGTIFLDLDNHGRQDIVIINGH